MSSTGATLSGSYSEASSVPSAAGFKYGTNTNNLNQTASVSASETSGNLYATLSGLSAGTTYYYQAFVTVNGTEDYASQSQTFYGTKYSFTTKKVATASVTTGSASGVSSSYATLNGSFSGASGTIYETGFYWGTSQGSLNNKVTTDGTNSSSGNFSCFIGDYTPLEESTTYYYQAYVLELDEASNTYVERFGSVQSFTTTAQGSVTSNYLTDYGMPDVSGLNPTLLKTGNNTDRDDHWYRYGTNNSKRQIAVHTYTSGSPGNVETVNYVVLYDENRYAPVWTAHSMNHTYWPDNNVGRASNSAWTNDPAISLTQQSGLDNAGTVGYSRGHFVASDYRQTTAAQNKQTFYNSNQAPQWQDSFNGGIWSSLEQNGVNNNVPSGSTMRYVITGVLYEGNITTKPSSGLNVPIPSHFYKCIMQCTFNGSTVTGAQGIAFVFTNQAHSGNWYDNAYVTSINSIETRAGFDFFAAVPQDLQDTAESNNDSYWFSGHHNNNNVDKTN